MNYYNDNDPFMANWIRCLIRDGFIPPGDVDERSINDVQPQDLEDYTQCHFFAGIGGWSLALQIAGWPTNEPVWTGSCPCQPLSGAGKREGEKDERHLWPEFYRLISECRPVRIFGEQVESGDGPEWLEGVSLDLEEIGYRVGAVGLPSACVGAPNIRHRSWWVADSTGARCNGKVKKSKGKTRDKARLFVPCPNCENDRLADAPCGGFGANGRTSRQGGHAEQCVEDHWMADSNAPRFETRSIHGMGNEPEGPYGERSIVSGGRMGNPERPGPSIRELHGRNTGKDLGSPEGQGLIQAGFWDQYRIIGGRDGKSRRIPVESAIFPLAPRVPGRVGLLRGSGNAINPWVAAEFIKAYMEVAGI